ncbi:MAG: Sir2 family NAD-dependent protein deacetylase [Deltaproteobacteria bacterium]|nr:Sir2 family NAD-dependent protein deacetylase [Deltaproteobacteria bacterium]
MNDLIERAAGIIREGNRILVFTGAGLSTESGIPDFRSPGGIWDRYDPQDFYYQKIVSDEGARQKYWKMSSEYYLVMKQALPNRAHLAVREIEDMGKLLAVVTQNIDSLHQRAGNSPDRIIEIHGTAFSVSCLSCGKRYKRDEIEERLKAGEKAPRCDSCKGILKPATVSFGQSMPEAEMTEAVRCARKCDVCMVLGSSLVVYPAASVPLHAAEEGAKLVIVNRDPTPLDSQAEVVIHESLGESLTRIMERVKSFH